MKKILLIALTIVTFLFLLICWKNSSFHIQNSNQDTKKLQDIQIGSQTLSVEVAKSIPEITLGLGQRDTLGSDGMLFVMPVRTMPTFWMKDMRFDLDFVWIDTEKVVDLTENVSAQKGEPDSNLRMYSPKFPATHVLEMNSGEVQKRGIKIGDAVKL